MIIGHGDISSVLPERDDLLFFASGVSNSREDRESEYTREIDLLHAQDRDKHIVYFSSLCVFDKKSRYSQHKRRMELMISIIFETYTIIRIGNITWGSNTNTIINFLKDKIQKGEQYTVEDVYRHILSKEEFLYWIDRIPSWSCEMNIPGKMMMVSEIVESIKKGEL
ncbi:MAG: hypothetical protein WC803_12925 [Sphingomonas sp.]|jgi:hypothetical protein